MQFIQQRLKSGETRERGLWEENHKKPQLGYSTFGQKTETRTSIVQSRRTRHSVAAFSAATFTDTRHKSATYAGIGVSVECLIHAWIDATVEILTL